MTTINCNCGFAYSSSEVKGKILTDLTKNSQHLRIEHICPRCNNRNTTYFLREGRPYNDNRTQQQYS